MGPSHFTKLKMGRKGLRKKVFSLVSFVRRFGQRFGQVCRCAPCAQCLHSRTMRASTGTPPVPSPCAQVRAFPLPFGRKRPARRGLPFSSLVTPSAVRSAVRSAPSLAPCTSFRRVSVSLLVTPSFVSWVLSKVTFVVCVRVASRFRSSKREVSVAPSFAISTLQM